MDKGKAGWPLGWDIEHRIYSNREEAWIRYSGRTIIVLKGDKHGDIMEKARKWVADYDPN